MADYQYTGHASLWSGTPGSWVDLSPTGTWDSVAHAVHAGQQVGSATTLLPSGGPANHAFLWSSTAASAVDLHAFLPSNFISSEARDIWHDGSGTYIAGFGQNTTTGRQEALLWTSAGCVAASVSIQPSPQTVCRTGTAAFSVTAAGTGPFTYRWQLQVGPTTWFTLGNDPGPISCPGGGSGFAFATPINSPTVSIGVRNCPGVQHWNIRAVVTNACHTATSDPAVLTICPADFNCDGARNVTDIFAFIGAWFVQSGMTGPGNTADFNGDNTVDVTDIFAYLAAWFAGC
jgi:hypothetical protein